MHLSDHHCSHYCACGLLRLDTLPAQVSMARGGVAGGAPAAGAAAPAGAKIGAASAVQDYDTYLSTYVSAVTKAAAALDKEVRTRH